jgi:hypothetical protein
MVIGSIVLLVVLAALTIKTATSGSDTAAGGATSTDPTTTAPVTPSSQTSSSTRPASSTAGSSRSSSAATSSSVAPLTCTSKALSVVAVVGQATYTVGDQPLLELQVTNTGPKPCVQDLADKQIELRVYNGESRVWGSHDCQIQPGSDTKTLASRTPVRVAITWSGLTSQPGCAGTRQRVGAGTYTLYALLSGRTGRATQFTVS